MPIKQTLLLIGFFLLSLQIGFAQPANKTVKLPKPSSPAQNWVDSIYTSLTLEQKIGQLFMVAAYSGGEKFNQPLIEKLLNEYGIGGLIFMQGTPAAQAIQTNQYQHLSKIPLLIAMDAEWGLGMRLTGVRDMPRQIMLGAMKDSTLVFKMGSAIASQCRRLGVHVNFAPVVDINNNPNNPVINFRAFGENKYKVANFSIQYMRGLQDNGIMACAKHFPGHGDTETDSHKDLPEIKKSLNDLKNLELFPFQSLIDNGIQSMMVAHLQVPALDKREHTPTTLSSNTITTLLKNEMHFKGLIFTDALNMQGIAKYYSPGDIDLKAFQAGNDVLLFSQDVPTGIEKIKAAIEEGIISTDRLEESVRKILMAKYNAGLSKYKNIDTTSINADLNEYITPIRQQVAEAAITLLNDPYQVIDKIKRNATKKIVYVGIGTSSENYFTKKLTDYGITDIRFASANSKDIKSFINDLNQADVIIAGIHNMSGYPGQNFGLDKNEIIAIEEINRLKKSMFVLFGNPYAVKNFCDTKGLIIAYDEAEETQEAVAKIITGQLKTKGKLPVSICPNYGFGEGIVSLTNPLGEVLDTFKFNKQNKTIRKDQGFQSSNIFNKDVPLECCISPNALGINIQELDKLDDYLTSSVKNNIFPGCRILVAKEGKVFYDKSFGYLKNDKRKPVDINTIYDIASITKVAATTIAVMKLYEEGKLDLNAKLGHYLSFTKGTDKEYLVIKDILMHQAGLKSWIPFYKETLDSFKKPDPKIYSKSESGKFSIKVSPNLYMHRDWIDTMWKRILYSPLENRGKYVYSDLDFIILQKVVETISKQPLDEYVRENFYKPMGMKFTAFQPKKNLLNQEIAPTEYDDYFRYQTIEGYVHDMGAAMFGGVSGHAGLFTTAGDLGILFQMLLNGGIYKGKRYLQRSTVDLFTAKGSSISRRGLGFDKPESVAGRSNPCSENVSNKAFGHQGFTGTCVWADPENNLLFVFLSNRTYPSAENKGINRNGGVREKAQSYIYNSLGIASRYRK